MSVLCIWICFESLIVHFDLTETHTQTHTTALRERKTAKKSDNSPNSVNCAKTICNGISHLVWSVRWLHAIETKCFFLRKLILDIINYKWNQCDANEYVKKGTVLKEKETFMFLIEKSRSKFRRQKSGYLQYVSINIFFVWLECFKSPNKWLIENTITEKERERNKHWKLTHIECDTPLGISTYWMVRFHFASYILFHFAVCNL